MPFSFQTLKQNDNLGVTVKFYHCLLYRKSKHRREQACNLMNRLYVHGVCVSLFAEFTQIFQEQRDADRRGIYC